ncbi:Peptidase S74 [Sphingobium herbicidovorans NBRC 16415]|uniref:Peptidase S74 n=1 Tax=Sphingobium herbicidovorans (strain ATCC 700291 / DSM 11019 / CCUG 56400 / KCTC 2939 / LMG 18315 / NBRC 16415 / MH) TaxID=1219045 RepID=A0A086PEB6_SPHHM|nr:hypothetical protein [Sphingobium herbicidovorans]KFG91734.1 Peptidase S74 [Sphingobium herbicidovorans NBRC 16415]
MPWYNAGTVAVTNNSATVTGTSTGWVGNVDAGQAFIGPNGIPYEILSVNSATSITLRTNYVGTTASGQAYRIMPVQGYLRDLATQAAVLVLSFATVRDGVGQGIFPGGSVGTPGFRFSGDEDTGIYRPSADAMALVTAGVERVRVDSNGALCVGRTAPDLSGARAVIADDSTGRGLNFVTSSGNGCGVIGTTGASDATAGLIINAYRGGGSIRFALNGQERWQFSSSGHLFPVADNVYDVGGAANRIRQFYSGTSTIHTSDEREKSWIGINADDRAKYLRIARAILDELGWFQFLESIEEKGADGARWHFGVRAQAVWAIVAGEGLCAPLIGTGAEQRPDPDWEGPPPPAWLCFDQWDEAVRQEPIFSEVLLDADGKPLQTGIRETIEREAGNRFGLRTDQLDLLLSWGLRELDKEKEALIADLTARVEALEAA